uniref:Glycosyltransferase family 92 protein n=1 Tax=Haemonchus contortus TaxID=6289 RepID=A0A7I4XYV9_HAECO
NKKHGGTQHWVPWSHAPVIVAPTGGCHAPRYRRLCCITCTSSLLFTLFAAIVAVTYFDQQHNNIIHEYVARNDDVAILSATFYNRSKSFENNTVILLLNAHQVLQLKHSELLGISTNASGSMKTSFRIFPVVQQIPFYCKWVPFIAVGQVSEGMTSLTLSTGEKGMAVPIRRPYSENHDVVACFSPLFLNERWQLLLLTAEVYSYYGAAMHFYVRSMITDLFLILTQYRNTRVQPWPAVRLGSKRANSVEFDPNIELEFRNQAAAMTDCLLLHK